MIGYALLGRDLADLENQRRAATKGLFLGLVDGACDLGADRHRQFDHAVPRPLFRQRWFSFPNIVYAAPVPILVALAALVLLAGLGRRRERAPFLAAAALFILSYLGLGISFYPYILPPSLTIWDAAAPAKSLEFLLVGAVVLIPLILAYTAWSYWVFRGKVGASAGYH